MIEVFTVTYREPYDDDITVEMFDREADAIARRYEVADADAVIERHELVTR